MAEFEEFTPAYLKEKMGLTPEQFIDLKALMGDKSDNIPGVTKIGEKTGIKLLLEYGSLDGIYEHIDEMKASKMKENLINDKEQAYLSKTLATIDTNAPIEIGLDDITYTGPHLENLAKFYEEMGFKQLRQALDLSGEEAAPVAIDYTEVEQVTSDMLTEDSFFHFEILGTITIRNPSSVLHGGQKVSSTRVQILVFTNTDFQRISRKNAPQGL